MARVRVVRPIVRTFEPGFERELALHVRAGGHAVLWSTARASGKNGRRRARFIFQRPRGRVELDLGYSAILDMELVRWSTFADGPMRGLAFVRVPPDCLDIALDRVTRDSVHPGSTRALGLDCMECAACCRNNRVEIDERDLVRFRRAGRAELGRAPYVREAEGKLVLRLLRDRGCRFLARDKTCAIYHLRPNSCRAFPPGSEGCLFSREEELGVVDGARS